MQEHITHFLPFMMLGVMEGKLKVNWTRIVEAIIFAAVGGLLSGYIAVQQMKVEIGGMKENMAKIEHKVDVMDERIYQHMKR